MTMGNSINFSHSNNRWERSYLVAKDYNCVEASSWATWKLVSKCCQFKKDNYCTSNVSSNKDGMNNSFSLFFLLK